jgi:hypothetical protein
MPTVIEKKIKRATAKKKNATTSKVRDYSNDPFFVKKAKAAEVFIKTHGLPPSFK